MEARKSRTISAGWWDVRYAGSMGARKSVQMGEVAALCRNIRQKLLEETLEQPLDLGRLAFDAGIVINPPVIEFLEPFQQGSHLGAVAHVVLLETMGDEVGHQGVNDGAVGAAQAQGHLPRATPPGAPGSG